MNAHDAPWGEASFERDRNWYGHLSADSESWVGDEKAHYNDLRAKAIDNPNFDLFDEFMPTKRPKHDIGRYVMSKGFNVPLVQDMAQWQELLMSDKAMLRSEARQDYSGQSGLYSSQVLSLDMTYPINEHGYPDDSSEWDENERSYVMRRTYQGPPNAKIDLGPIEMLYHPFSRTNLLGNTAIIGTFSNMLRDGIYDGSVNPAMYMRLRHWDREYSQHMIDAQHYRYKHNLSPEYISVSRWQYVPGVNLRVFKDNVIDGKYFIGGQQAHHHWEVTEGIESADVEAHTKSGYRGTPSKATFEYSLPTGKIVELYEKVRTLPYFDQRQCPVMEMQYGHDGKLHFLQYLKTGLMQNDPGEFKLPNDPTAVTVYDVRGITPQDGEKVRIYMEPEVFTERMHQQAFYVGIGMSNRFSNVEQVASLMSKAMVLDNSLNFKNNHFSSSPLTRSPLALGLWDGVGEAEVRFRDISAKQHHYTSGDYVGAVDYLDAVITSNGRKAVIQSDWELKSEKIN